MVAAIDAWQHGQDLPELIHINELARGMNTDEPTIKAAQRALDLRPFQQQAAGQKGGVGKETYYNRHMAERIIAHLTPPPPEPTQEELRARLLQDTLDGLKTGIGAVLERMDDITVQTRAIERLMAEVGKVEKRLANMEAQLPFRPPASDSDSPALAATAESGGKMSRKS